MATNFNDYFNSNRISTSQANPRFHFDNESSTGANDGTPLIAEMLNDLYAFFIGLAIDQGVTLSNIEERQNKTADNHSQFFTIMENFIRPIGFPLIEYPGFRDLDELYPNVVWENLDQSFAGLFFRVAGGGAIDFEGIPTNNAGFGGTQGDHVRSHTHLYTRSVLMEEPFVTPGGSNPPAPVRERFQKLTNTTADRNYSYIETTDVASGTNASNLDTRSRNKTVRFWRKTGVQF